MTDILVSGTLDLWKLQEVTYTNTLLKAFVEILSAQWKVFTVLTGILEL